MTQVKDSDVQASERAAVAPALLTPFQLAPYDLPNRIVMAPMTRCRAGEGNVPTKMNATYYAQRASAGLIIAEATQVSPQGVGYPNTPGIHSDDQVAGWRLVTDAVHAKGRRIFLQLWHVGRLSHPSFLGGALPVAPSAIAAEGEVFTMTGPQKMVVPRALEQNEIPGIIEQFRRGAENAKQAGFDGVEIHGANGYLLDQFLQDVSNHRSDEYGGSVENRARFMLEVTRAVVSVWGSERVGIRLSPSGVHHSMGDSDPRKTFGFVVQELGKLDLAYLHLLEPFVNDPNNPKIIDPVVSYFRPLYPGTIMTNKGYTFDTANQVIESGQADLVSFGRLFLANPDLPERFKRNVSLNEPDPDTFYKGGEKGYIDYPALA